MENNGLSLFSTESATNEDIIVTYTPSFSVTSYSYSVIKDGVKGNLISVNSNNPSNIVLTETGTYQIEIINNDYIYGTKIINSGNYIIDKEIPVITVDNDYVELKMGDSLNIMNGVKAQDNIDGDLTSFVTTNENQLDFNTIGNKTLVYTVKDNAGNIATKEININITQNYDNYLHTVQFTIFAFIVFIIVLIITFINTIKKEKRLMFYSIKPIKDNNKTLMESINKKYNLLIDKFTDLLSKSEFINNYSKKYLKYVETLDNSSNTVKFISRKIIYGLIFIIVAIITATIRLSVLRSYELLLAFIVGFYTLDIIYIYKYKMYRKKIENDLLQAIIIMNNAFKSGRSITQAVDLVGEELEGPIALEFKKVSMELSFGLSIEVAFKRFADRIQMDEANYLTSSLSILNKTGGNIIKVFNSIEKTLFNRKKLRLELKSLTGSSKLIMYVLILVPISFIALVSFINKDYFAPLFSSTIGIIIVLIIILLYVLYIFIVRKVMKIRM